MSAPQPPEWGLNLVKASTPPAPWRFSLAQACGIRPEQTYGADAPAPGPYFPGHPADTFTPNINEDPTP